MVSPRQTHKSTVGSIIHRLEIILNYWRVFIFRNLGIEINYSSNIATQVKAILGSHKGESGHIKIGHKVKLCQGVILDCWGGKIICDENVFIGPYTVIYGHGTVNIGKDSLIAMHCRIISSNHTIPDCNTMIRSQPNISLPVNIGKDVWLGAGVTVLGGVTIGDGCVIGAGSVITEDIPPYCIAVGVPAKVIDRRSKSKESQKSLKFPIKK